MARYTQNSINGTASRNNIVDVVSSYVHLKRTGTSYVGLCPFHKEKTPSFHVSEDKQLFYCFGCGTSGNIFDFVMKIENLDFVDSLKFLAQRAGVTLEEEHQTFKENEEERNIKKRILEMNKLAARKYYDNLFDKDSLSAREYVKKRALEKGAIIRFGLGYAKDSWDDILNYLKSSGYSQDEIVLAGLAAKNDKGRVYDKFRNRLMFPIIDVRGNVVAFSGRAIGDDPAKYMNSPETPVFYKSRNVFGLNIAKQYSKTDGVILVEGNMDVVSLYQKGFPNAIAGLGTAFTEEHARLIKRYANMVYVCYDGDEAGQKAAIKAVDILTDMGNSVKVVTFTGAKDPDEFILKKGTEAFRDCLRKALAPAEFKIMKVRKNFDLTDSNEKISFVNEAAKILADVENTVEREVYIKSIAKETDISEKSITSEINKIIFSKTKKENDKKQRIINNVKEENNIVSDIAEKQNTGTYKTELMLLNIMFFDEKAFKVAKESAEESLFSGNVNKQLFKEIIKYKEENESATAPEFITT
ncbi:MAG: DNA primase, partial [Clostridia bacterium]|nr:DNA primase [Clostridia bacterium]